MKKKVVAGLVAGLFAAQGFAQSNSNANAQQTSVSGASASTSGSGNSSLNNVGNSGGQSNSSANTSSVSGATAGVVGNSQNNGSASSSRAIGRGGEGGQGGSAGINANISPSTNITFTSPPTSTQRVEQVSSGGTTSRVIQEGVTTQNLNSVTASRQEQVISGGTYSYTEQGGTTTIKNVPSMNAPPLTSSNDTCMGSASAGLALAGLGLSGGSTYTDEHCKRIKMSRELWNKGMKAASLAMDCMDPAAREALELTGFTCPQTVRARQQATANAQQPRPSSSAHDRVPEQVDPSRQQPGFTTAAASHGAVAQNEEAANAQPSNGAATLVQVMSLEQQASAEQSSIARRADLEPRRPAP